jgi:Mg2+ and Co2+ transporter CorA
MMCAADPPQLVGRVSTIAHMKYATLVGIAPFVLAFVAGFFGLPVPDLGPVFYIAWLAASLTVGAGIVLALKARTEGGV